jgi:DNA-binding transcriptional LysR family regulator
VEAAELAGTRLIVREPGSGTRETLERALAEAGVPPAKPLMVLDANAAVRSAAAGAGPAVLSAAIMQADLADGRVVEVPVHGIDLHRRLHAVWARGNRPSGPAEALLGIAVHSYRGTAPRT